VLFLDEFAEYSRSSLEALRQPLEDGTVRVVRAAETVKFPAQFMLVAAANPCPCGYLGHPKKECQCLPGQVKRYQKRLSGPILDRIDIHVNVPFVEVEKLKMAAVKSERSAQIRERVRRAREIQVARFEGEKRLFANAGMKNKQIKKYCRLEPAAEQLLQRAANNFQLSARSYFRLIKVGQTIADLAASGLIKSEHIAEALQYRIREK
jgi:magnesium chelatase family protein